MFRINISGESTLETGSLIEWANSLLPPILLLTLTWFLRKLLNLPDKMKKDKHKKGIASPQSDEGTVDDERTDTSL